MNVFSWFDDKINLAGSTDIDRNKCNLFLFILFIRSQMSFSFNSLYNTCHQSIKIYGTLLLTRKSINKEPNTKYKVSAQMHTPNITVRMSRIVMHVDNHQWQLICMYWGYTEPKKLKKQFITYIWASRLVYIGLEGKIQRKICKVVYFHFEAHKLFIC